MTNKIASKAVTAALIGLLSVVGAFAQPTITAVVNGASFQSSGIASNTWITIFGTNLALSTRAWKGSDFVNGTLPTSLDGVSVKIEMCYSYLPGYNNGARNTAEMNCAYEPAFVEYISPTQLNVLVVHTAEFLTILGNPTYAEFVMILGGQIQVTTAAGSSVWSPPVYPGSGLGMGTWYGSAFFVVGGSYVAGVSACWALGQNRFLRGSQAWENGGAPGASPDKRERVTWAASRDSVTRSKTASAWKTPDGHRSAAGPDPSRWLRLGKPVFLPKRAFKPALSP